MLFDFIFECVWFVSMIGFMYAMMRYGFPKK